MFILMLMFMRQWDGREGGKNLCQAEAENLTRVRYSEGGSGVGEREGRFVHGEASLTAQSFLGERKSMMVMLQCFGDMIIVISP